MLAVVINKVLHPFPQTRVYWSPAQSEGFWANQSEVEAPGSPGWFPSRGYTRGRRGRPRGGPGSPGGRGGAGGARLPVGCRRRPCHPRVGRPHLHPRPSARRSGDMVGAGRWAPLLLCLLQSAPRKAAGRAGRWLPGGGRGAAGGWGWRGARPRTLSSGRRDGGRSLPAATGAGVRVGPAHPPPVFCCHEPNRFQSLKFLSGRNLLQFPNPTSASGEQE